MGGGVHLAWDQCNSEWVSASKVDFLVRYEVRVVGCGIDALSMKIVLIVLILIGIAVGGWLVVQNFTRVSSPSESLREEPSDGFGGVFGNLFGGINGGGSTALPTGFIARGVCPSVEDLVEACGPIEPPRSVEQSVHEEQTGFTCLYKVDIPEAADPVSQMVGLPPERAVVTAAVTKIDPPSQFAADLSFQFAIQPFFTSSGVIAENEIGTRSLRGPDALGFSTASGIVLITETNGNRTCTSDRLLQFGNFFTQ